MRLLAPVLLSASFASVSMADSTNRIEPTDRNEFARDRVQTSSDLVVGAVYDSKEELPSPPLYQATIPAKLRDQKVCLRTKSRDGFYESEYDYTVPSDWEHGVLEFEYPTDYADRVSSPPRDNTLAVGAYFGVCDEDGGDLIVGFWNVPEDPGARDVILALNTVGADRAYVYVGDDLSAEANLCSPISADRTAGFDYTCPISIPEDMLPVSKEEPARIEIEINVVHNRTNEPARKEFLYIVK